MTKDFIFNIRGSYTKDDRNLLYARSKIVLAARSHGCLPIDTPYLNILDKKGCGKTAQKSKALGFSGMLALHPNQVNIINKCFAPSKKEIFEAKQIIKQDKKNKINKRNISFSKGMFVAPPMLKKAKQILSYKNKIYKIK